MRSKMIYSGTARILDDSPSGKTLEAMGRLKDWACVRPVALLIAYIMQPDKQAWRQKPPGVEEAA